jgi:hypothetical protein
MKFKHILLLLCILILHSNGCDNIRQYKGKPDSKIFGEFVAEHELKRNYEVVTYSDNYIKENAASCNQYCGLEFEVFTDTEVNSAIVYKKKCFVECFTIGQESISVNNNKKKAIKENTTLFFAQYFYVTIDIHDKKPCNENTLITLLKINNQKCELLKEKNDVFFKIVGGGQNNKIYQYHLLTGRLTANYNDLEFYSFGASQINAFITKKNNEVYDTEFIFDYNDFEYEPFCIDAFKAIAELHRLTHCEYNYIGFDSFENGEVNFDKKVDPLGIIKKINPSFYTLEQRVNNLHVLRLYYFTYNNKMPLKLTEKKLYFNYSKDSKCSQKLENKIEKEYFLTDCEKNQYIGYDSFDNDEINFGSTINALDYIKNRIHVSYILERKVNNLHVLRLYSQRFDDSITVKKLYFNYSKNPECSNTLEEEVRKKIVLPNCKNQFIGYNTKTSNHYVDFDRPFNALNYINDRKNPKLLSYKLLPQESNLSYNIGNSIIMNKFILNYSYLNSPVKKSFYINFLGLPCSYIIEKPIGVLITKVKSKHKLK